MVKSDVDLVNFIALMGTSALALATKIIFGNTFLSEFSVLLELGVIFIFILYFTKFLIHLLKRDAFLNNIKNPLKSNLYSAISISSALISIMLVSIGIPFLHRYDIVASAIFWCISLIFSLIFVVIVPINLKFRSKIEHITGSWFLPPVGLFVLITSGSLLALKIPYLKNIMIIINLLLFGPAFILYFLTLTLLYYKSKVQEDIQEQIIPTFHIILAPVGVSILATISTSKLLLSNDFLGIAVLFSGLVKIYSLIMFGYGLWLVFGLITLYHRIIKEKKKIPFSELWWAFVFPTGAFILATINIYLFVTQLVFIKIIYQMLYIIVILLWFYILGMNLKNLIKR